MEKSPGLNKEYRPNDVFTYDDITGMKRRRSETTLNWKRQVTTIGGSYEVKHPSIDRRPLPKESTAVKDARNARVVYVEYGDITADDL